MASADRQRDEKAQFERLPPGKTSRTPEETAEHQRERLLRAMVDAVARNGFAATTLREVVGLAGVSNRSFYEHFDSMQDCFLAAFDRIAAGVVEKSRAAFRAESEFPRQMQAVLEAYLGTIVSEPSEAHLMLVDLIGLGSAGVARRQEVAGGFESLISESFEGTPGSARIPELAVRGIVGGIQRIAYRRVRYEEIERLQADFALIRDWSLSYLRVPGEDLVPPFRGRAVAIAADGGEELDLAGEWDEPHERAALRQLDRRERIIRAATTVSGERGYASLSIPAITRVARVSNETFYENFSSAEEAFFAAIDTLAWRLLSRMQKAVEAQTRWENKVEAGLEALLVFLSEKPGLAHLIFIEALAAGPPTLERADLMLDALAAMLLLGERPGPKGKPLHPSVVEALSGGPFFIVQHEISEHRVSALPQLLPELAAFVLAPYG